MLNRIQELLPELRLQLIAEHHPEAATLRDSRASWQHRVRSSEDSGTNAASKIVSLFFGVLFVIALVATSIQKKDFETKFARIKAGLMTDTEVVELLGRPDKQTRTKMIWGDLYPRYNDEHRYTVNLSDGIVTSTDVERGTESRGY